MIFNKKVTEEIDKISEIAGYLWERGWAERNAGNLSFNLTDLIDPSEYKLKDKFFTEKEMPAGTENMVLFITGTGKRLRDLRVNPERASGIIVVDNKRKGFYTIWSDDKANFTPTSEFPSHLNLHVSNNKKNNGYKAVLHTHPTDLIALTHNSEIIKDEEKLNIALWGMLPEVRVFVPKGVAFTSYLLPSSLELANKTIEGFENRDVVIWEKHGAVACGKDMIEAFDFIDVSNKGAIIYLTCLQAGYTPEGMSAEQLKDLEQFL